MMNAVLAMDVLQVAAEVATLSELFVANITDKRPRRCVLPEVVTQVAALAENGVTASKLALKVEFGTFCFFVVHLEGLMPLDRNPFKFFLGGRSVQGANFRHANGEIFLFFGGFLLRRQRLLRFLLLTLLLLVHSDLRVVLAHHFLQLRQQLSKSAKQWLGLVDNHLRLRLCTHLTLLREIRLSNWLFATFKLF